MMMKLFGFTCRGDNETQLRMIGTPGYAKLKLFRIYYLKIWSPSALNNSLKVGWVIANHKSFICSASYSNPREPSKIPI